MHTYIYTFGCKVNQVESEKIVNELKFYNLELVDNADNAELIIYNTCAVTERAEKKFHSMVRKAKNLNPNVKIAVTGCAAEKDKDRLKELGADIVVTNSGKMNILENIVKETDHLNSIFESHGFIDAENMSMATRTRAFVKIQDGCDSNCAYCIIPSLRGLPVSRAEDSILKEVKNLVDAGYKEIVPVGIHVGKYGSDLNGDIDLAGLIEKMIALDGDFRVRLTSIELNELTDRMIDLLADNTDRICRHYHIPLQSGSTHTLRMMNRKYTSEEYVAKLKKLKDKVPDCTLGADVIVGFPGETEIHFAETVSTVRRSGLEHLHVFSYSDRSGTKASTMENKTPQKVKSERSRELRALGDKLKEKAAGKCIGKIFKVLTQKDNTGITDNYFTVRFKEDVEPGRFLDVLITYAYKDGSLKGDIVNV
jgi:threonylcarbamoyladenosine tRNA methylthiotransferase MtaB